MKRAMTKKQEQQVKEKVSFKELFKGKKLNKFGEYLLKGEFIEMEYVDMRAVMRRVLFCIPVISLYFCIDTVKE